MFACLHLVSEGAPTGAAVELASHFSPLVEDVSAHTALCDISGLARLLGAPEQIAGLMAERAAALGLQVNIAIAANPDTALLAARYLHGPTIIAPGREAEALGPLSIHTLAASAECLETLERWGITTLRELGKLPPLGLAARLGEEGERLRLLARGELERPLEVTAPPEEYQASFELEDPVALLEPLLFYVSAMLNDLVPKLKRQTLAASQMTLTLALIDGSTHIRAIEFPLPVQEVRTLLKQAQLDLEAHPPAAAVRVLEVRLDPAPPRTLQGGLFRPATPEPDKLHVILARIAALVGSDRVGSPELLDTYRPDAYRMRPNALLAGMAANTEPATPDGNMPLRLSCRLFRPALKATVRLAKERPVRLTAANIRGAVLEAAGPWRTSGEWWTATRWSRDEWDVGLDNGALYRIYRELESSRWFVDALYD
jgi:protein ImuB